MWNDRQELCRSSVVITSAEHTTNRLRRAIRGSERSAGTRAPDHERGGAMYDRRSRQPITPQHLITPRPIEAGWSAISSLGCRSLGPPVDYSARQKVRLIDTLSEHLIKDNFHFLWCKKITCIKSKTSDFYSPPFFVNFKLCCFNCSVSSISS